MAGEADGQAGVSPDVLSFPILFAYAVKTCALATLFRR